MSCSAGQPKYSNAVAEHLNRAFRAALIAFFSRRLKDARAPCEDAEDLTQEVFIRLANHPDQQNGEKIHAYIFTIAANVFRDRLKTSAAALQQKSRNLDHVQEDFANIPELTEAFDPERVLVAKDTLKEVLTVLSELDVRTRNIFILFRLENMQQREIADHYRISISAVQKHIHKASSLLGARFARQ